MNGISYVNSIEKISNILYKHINNYRAWILKKFPQYQLKLNPLSVTCLIKYSKKFCSSWWFPFGCKC